MTELPSWCRAGQRVVCVNAWAWYDPAQGPLSRFVTPCVKQDGVYTISRLNAYGYPFVQLAEFDANHGWWPADRFRPVRDTSIESLRALLRPTPDETRRLLETENA